MGIFEVDINVDGVAAGFAHEDMIGLVLLEDVIDDFGGPLEFAEGLLFSEKIAIDHHAGLGGVAEMIFQ